MKVNKKLLVGSILLLTFLAVFAYCRVNFATEHTVNHLLTKLPQNALVYLDENNDLIIKPKQQVKLAQNYIQHYFSPWEEKFSNKKLTQIKQELLSQYKEVERNPGIGPNTHVYTQTWVRNLQKNANLTHFPNADQNAITLRDSNVRILPTLEPSFTDLNSVSKGYPFDNLQQTFISAGTPIHIVQISQDKAWYLVVACSYSGWVASDDVAFVSSTFKKNWQTGSYAVSTQDNIPIFDNNRRLATKTRIGAIYPVVKEEENNYIILMPNQTATGYATLQKISVSKQFLNKFPVPLISRNIALAANNLLGKPYGWGGIYGYRDCSATTKDLMATFGIWLPRNSGAQMEERKLISLVGLSNSEKEKTIVRNATPFLTLIHIPGHIVLYIGERKGHPIVFQDMWGLHIYKFFGKKDRIVIGKTVITPLSFGKRFINASLNHLTAADSMMTLVTPSDLVKETAATTMAITPNPLRP